VSATVAARLKPMKHKAVMTTAVGTILNNNDNMNNYNCSNSNNYNDYYELSPSLLQLLHKNTEQHIRTYG